MPRGNGGVIGPANIPTTSSAKGVWALSELTLAVRQGIWPSPTPTSDPYFEYTTLLLPGSGTSGTQNNSFLDSGNPAEFTASIAATTMTVTSVASGTIKVGMGISGSGVTAGTTVTAFVTGSGGAGTYTVSASQTVSSTTITSTGFPITRNPLTGPNAPTQGTFSPFSQTGWGNYFDGSGDYLSTSASAISSVGANNFSFECFVYCTRQTNTYAQGLISYGISGDTAGTSYISFQLDSSGYLVVAYATVASFALTDTALFPLNQWVHAVVCRSGSTLSLFVNGTRKATTSTSATVGSTGNVLNIGSQWYANDPLRQLQGYISNARILNGTSAYDATSTLR